MSFKMKRTLEMRRVESAFADYLESEKADHYILNFLYNKNRKLFRAEAYYKKYSDLVKSKEGNYGTCPQAGEWRISAEKLGLAYFVFLL